MIPDTGNCCLDVLSGSNKNLGGCSHSRLYHISISVSPPVPSQMLCTRFQRSWKGRSTWSLQPTPSLWKCQRPSCTCRKTVSASPQRQAAYLGNKTENKDGHWYVLYYFHGITRWLLFWSWFDLLNDTACSKNELYADSMTALLYD